MRGIENYSNPAAWCVTNRYISSGQTDNPPVLEIHSLRGPGWASPVRSKLIRDSQARFVAGFFGDLLYSWSKSRGRTERTLGTAPQQIISRGTFHEWPETWPAILPCVRHPPCDCRKRGEQYGWIWRSRFHRF